METFLSKGLTYFYYLFIYLIIVISLSKHLSQHCNLGGYCVQKYILVMALFLLKIN